MLGGRMSRFISGLIFRAQSSAGKPLIRQDPGAIDGTAFRLRDQ